LQLVLTPLQGDRPAGELFAEVGPYVVGGVGILGVALGAIAGGLALSKSSTANANCSAATMTCNNTGHTAAGLVQTLGPVTTAGFIIGGVGLVGGGVWLGVQRSKASQVGVGVGPVVGGTTGHVEWSW
jgi:hypothetical protein